VKLGEWISRLVCSISGLGRTIESRPPPNPCPGCGNSDRGRIAYHYGYVKDEEGTRYQEGHWVCLECLKHYDGAVDGDRNDLLPGWVSALEDERT
jgi:hypothetical protein